MDKNSIKPGDIIIGKPLRWNVFDAKGNLLLKEGSVIESDFQFGALMERGLFYYGRQDRDRQISSGRIPFEIIDDIYSRLNIILESIRPDTKLPSKIIKLCRMLQNACEEDHNACLGIIPFGQDYKYPVIHSIHTALACQIISKGMGWSPEERLMPMAAALTMNIAMIDLQKALYFQREPLTEYQSNEIKSHPERSVDFLEKCGVKDDAWLNAVFQHHELLDGSGYPMALKGRDIVQLARIVTIGDMYSAKTANRAYRSSVLPARALHHLFQNKESVDAIMSSLLIKKLGIYPPGSFVELMNGEIAVVTHAGKDARFPVLHSVVKANGTAMVKPVLRDCTIREFAIKRTISKNDARIEVNKYQLWGYSIFTLPLQQHPSL